MTIKKFDEFGDRNYVKPIKNRLTYQELIELDKEIERFCFEKEIDFPRKMKIKTFDQWKWLEYRGAAKNKAIIVNNFKSAIYNSNGTLKEPCDCKPILFEQLMEDFNQWHRWKETKEFAQEKQIEGLEKVAESFKVPDNW